MNNLLLTQLKRHEGFRGRPYFDTEGFLTIGFGRNLDHRPLTQDEAMYLLVRDLEEFRSQLTEKKPFMKTLDQVRHDALLNMAYNLGVPGLLKFKRMWAALAEGDYKRAGAEALDSKWAKQVGHRALELAYQLETGRYYEDTDYDAD